MDRAGNLRGAVASELAGEGKGPEELEHTRFVQTFVRIDLRIGPFEIAVRDHGRCAMAWTGNVDHVQVILSNDTIQVNPGEGLAGVRTPVPEESILEMLGADGVFQQRVVTKVDHPRAKVVASPPVGIDFAEFFGGQDRTRSRLG